MGRTSPCAQWPRRRLQDRYIGPWNRRTAHTILLVGITGDRVPVAGAPSAGAELLEEAIRRAPGRVDAALDGFDFRAATAAVWTSSTRPTAT